MTVLLDLGMVLASPETLWAEHAARLGVDEAAMVEAYWADRRLYDAGQPDTEYWSGVMTRLGVTPDADTIAALARHDAERWTDIRPGARELVRAAKAAGQRVLVLSNAPASLEPVLRAQDWMRDVDDAVVSGTVGHIKPEPEIYALVEDLAGDEIWFIDDRAPNVDAALARGWHAHLWVDDADSLAWLRAEGLLGDQLSGRAGR